MKILKSKKAIICLMVVLMMTLSSMTVFAGGYANSSGAAADGTGTFARALVTYDNPAYNGGPNMDRRSSSSASYHSVSISASLGSISYSDAGIWNGNTTVCEYWWIR